MGRFLLRSLIANGMVSLSEPAAPPPPPRRRLLLERLEDRLLFDAGPVAPVDADAELMNAQASQEGLSQSASISEPADVRVFESLDQVEAVVADLSGTSSATELVPGTATAVAVDGSSIGVLADEPNDASLDTDELAEQLLTTTDESRTELSEGRSGLRDKLLAAQEVTRSEVVTRHEIAFVDTSLVGHEQLVSDLLAQHDPAREMQIVLIGPQENGLAKITETLRQESGIDAIHVLSHGDSHGFRLGSQWVTSDVLAGYSEEVSSWKDALLDGADVLIYGCDLASATAGRELLQSLSALTGADVAASDDLTGSSSRGGDWDLEFRIGEVSTASALSDGGAFEGTLVTVDVGNGAIIGALNRSLYSIDVATGKATLITTAPATIGGVALGAAINSVATDTLHGLIYYADNASSSSNVALFAYDYVNDTHALIDSDLTDNGVSVGSRGLGSGSAHFANSNQTLYLGVERVTNNTNVLYAITFTAASNGRTVQGGTTQLTYDLSGATFGSHDWGDIVVDPVADRLYDFDGGGGVMRIMQLDGTVLATNSNGGLSSTQQGTDQNGNQYMLTNALRLYDTTNNTLGSAKTVTTNGTTAWGSAYDASGPVPATGQIGDVIFDDNNGDGLFNGTDTGINSVTVNLYDDVDADGTVDVGVDRLLATATSNSSGAYSFDGVLPGNYLLVVTDTHGVLEGAASTTGGAARTTSLITIGDTDLSIDFGYSLATPPVGGDNSRTTQQDTDYTFATSDFPFSDADGDPLAEVRIDSLPTNGTLLLDGVAVSASDVVAVADIASGKLVFRPDATESGSPYATFDFSVGDGTCFVVSPCTMTMNVTPVVVLGEPDLSVSISNGVATLTAGQTTTYSITITNDGEQSATGVMLSGSLPVDRMTFVSSDDAANFSIDGSGSFVWTPAVGSLAPGDSLTLLLTAQVGSALASGITEVTIPVSVTHDNIEPTPANNSAQDNDVLDAAPDLRLSKTDYTDSVSPGPCSSYTINVGNFGTQEATNVVVTETIPDGSTFNPALSDPGWTSVGGNVYEYSIVSLPAGASFNVNLSVFIDNPADAGREVIVNTVTITDDGTNGPDLDPTDNSATDTDTLDALPMYDIGIDDLQLSAVPGESLTYYVNFNNYGLQNGTGVVITVSFPTSLLTNVVASDGGIVDTLAGTITWNVGDLPANDPRTFEIAADVREVIPNGVSDVTLTANIADDGTNGPDPDLSDNSSSDTDTLAAPPDYQITIDDGQATVRPGDPLIYMINVSNQGERNGSGVIVTVNFPTSLLENVVALNGGVVDGVAGTISWNLGDLEIGDTKTLLVTTQVRTNISSQATSLTLSATVTDDGLNGADPTPLNNLDDDLDRLQVYAYDTFHDWKNMRSAFLAPQRFEVGRPLAPLPVDPVFSGLTEPGSTLVARIYDADGRLLGDRQVVADTGGNWLVTFPNIVIYEQPHRMEIIVTPAINNAVHENGFNLRRYFHPAVHTELFMNESLSVASVFRNRAYNIIEAQHSANTHPLGFHWFSHAYELNAASTNVAQM